MAWHGMAWHHSRHCIRHRDVERWKSEMKREKMIWLLLLGLFLVCAGMSLVFSVYLCLLWLATIRNPPPSAPVTEAGAAKAGMRGISAVELEVLAEAKDGGGLVGGSECAVCLEDIEAGQRARVLRSCRHSFHVGCADAWLLAHPHCPLCRTTLIPPPLSS